MLTTVEKTKLALLFPKGQFAPAPAPAPAPAQQSPTQPVPPSVQKVDKATDVTGEEDEQLERQQAVRGVIQELRQLIVLLAHHIWQMKLTEEQVSVLADTIMNQIAQEINDITVDRVKELANDLLLGLDEKTPKWRKRKK